MNLGTLATIASFAPENYLLVILDNCCYSSTGSQPTCTHLGTDLASMAKAAGIKEVSTITDIENLRLALERKGVKGLIVVKVGAGNADVPIIDISPDQIVSRFMGSFLQVVKP